MAQEIHPTAIVDPGAQLGKDVVVGPFSIIEDNVIIGDGTTIGSHVLIKAHTTIGRNNRIHSYAFAGGDPQDLKYQGEPTTLVIGDNNSIREFATLHRGTVSGGGITKVGNNCLLMAYVHIAHDCVLGDAVILSNAVMLAGHVLLGDHVVVGGMTGIHQFVNMGEYSFAGGMSGVAQDIPPYMLTVGNRAKIHGPNAIGLRRQGFTIETVTALRNAYRKIWRSDIPRQEALDEVEQESGSLPEVKKLLDFVRGSERGVASAAKNGSFNDD